MSRIEAAFERSNHRGMPCFIPYLTAGLPDEELFMEVVGLLWERGARIMEVGIPFSDPVLDGVVLQRANSIAIEKGINTKVVLRLVKGIRERFHDLAIVLMSYLNPIYSYGIRDFMEEAKAAGVDGIIVPDCPVEESGIWSYMARSMGLATIFMVTELTDDERFGKIHDTCSGFIYYTTVKGVTGPREHMAPSLIKRLTHFKAISKLPIAAGFGICNRWQVRLLSNVSDGIVMGSAIIEQLLYPSQGNALVALEKFLSDVLGQTLF